MWAILLDDIHGAVTTHVYFKFIWLMHFDLAQKKMVFNNSITHDLIIDTSISYEHTFTIAIPTALVLLHFKPV